MMRKAAFAVPLVLVAALFPGAPAAAHGGAYTPGAPGVGDPYYPLDGNGGYDVGRYDLDLRYTPATDVLAGSATIRARATQNLSAFNLDLHGLTVRSITVDGRPAAWSRAGDELTVTPRRGIRKHRPFTTVVRYDGVPQVYDDPALGPGGVFHTDDGMVIIGQPDVAAAWFPANDHPTDKARFTIAITAPAGLEVVSNGDLVARRRAGSGWTRWTWRAAEPMATYLAMATVGEYDLDSYTRGGIRYVDAVDPDLDAATRAVVDASFARQPEIVRFLESYAGAYPFRSSGGIVDDTEAFGYALETQARPIYDYRFFTDAQSGDSVVVHELAHQWYGDSLAVQQWDDIWLNEGFATYMEWLWAEREGIQTTQERFDTSYTSLPASFWTVRPGNPGPTNIFDYAVYERGAMTLHQLRRAVGDRVFFRILHGWAQSREGDNVSTAEFIAYAERRSGRELSPLFDAWLYTPSRPALPAAAAATASTRAAAPALRR